MNSAAAVNVLLFRLVKQITIFVQQFGEVSDYSVDSSLPSITLNYKTRKEAEAALLKGKHFQVMFRLSL